MDFFHIHLILRRCSSFPAAAGAVVVVAADGAADDALKFHSLILEFLPAALTFF